jgi:hypothetical protein
VLRADTQPFDGPVIAALEAVFSALWKSEVHVCQKAQRASSIWQRHHLLPLLVPVPTSDHARRFVFDRLAFSPSYPHSALLVPLAVLASRRPTLNTFLGDAITVSPTPASAGATVVQIGRNRVRAFDLERHETVVADVCRPDAPRSIDSELAARAIGPSNFQIPLIATDPDSRWLKEQLVPGKCLARMPPWIRRQPLIDAVIAQLAEWSGPTVREVVAADYAHRLMDRFSGSFNREHAALARSARLLARQLPPKAVIRVGPSHGDLQQANVIVDRTTNHIWITDFEHFAERSVGYDAAVLRLGLRWRATPTEAGTYADLHSALTGDGPESIESRVFALEQTDWILGNQLRP